eukprot:TRINITY_DN13231_c0_g1_i1.p1 TRINITY_DN13231_c0_g1~~TRINITY_DN13231_c0_g1_i1.p1  ORF type:complete len:306 (+),score=100.90 TRINITY_DN13231_c0_g1_i1:20-937(+)
MTEPSLKALLDFKATFSNLINTIIEENTSNQKIEKSATEIFKELLEKDRILKEELKSIELKHELQTKINQTRRKILVNEEQTQNIALKLRDIKNKLEDTLIECNSVNFLIPKRKIENDHWSKKKRKIDLKELVDYSSFIATTTAGPPLVPEALFQPPHPQRVIMMSCLYEEVPELSLKTGVQEGEKKKEVTSISIPQNLYSDVSQSNVLQENQPSLVNITDEKLIEISKNLDNLNKPSELVTSEVQSVTEGLNDDEFQIDFSVSDSDDDNAGGDGGDEGEDDNDGGDGGDNENEEIGGASCRERV